MENMDKFFGGKKDKSTDSKSSESIPDGTISTKKYRNYYDVSNTISTAGASNPNDFDSPVYNRERIFVDEERYAEKLLVSNDGTDTLFVVVSHSSELSMSQEVPLYPGEVKIYYNVYEVRLRSPTEGNAYRVMEYELYQNGISNQYLYSNITAAAPTTTTVKSSSGFLHSITINKATANGVIAIYDGDNATGTLVATITSPAALTQNQFTLIYDIKMPNGITIVTSGAAQDITVSYR